MEFMLFGFALFALVVSNAAYRNGVNDGYMAARDWNCPGYAKAIQILKQYGKWMEPVDLWQRIKRGVDWERRESPQPRQHETPND